MTESQLIEMVQTLPNKDRITISSLLNEAYTLINSAEVLLIHHEWRGSDSDLPILINQKAINPNILKVASIFKVED